MDMMSDSHRAEASLEDPLELSPDGMQQGYRDSTLGGEMAITRHGFNPYGDNPHAATGNYSLVVDGSINPNRPVTSMLPPLERSTLLKTAEERAARRERKEVVRKLGNAPGYARGTKSWENTLEKMRLEQEQREKMQSEAHRQQYWDQLKAATTPRVNRVQVMQVATQQATKQKREEVAKSRRMIVRKAADKSRMNLGTYWNKKNAERFEDLMHEVLPEPRMPTPGEIEVYNSPRPSVLDSDEEDEQERRLVNALMAMPPTELPSNRLSEARLMHTFDNASLYTSTAAIEEQAMGESGTLHEGSPWAPRRRTRSSQSKGRSNTGMASKPLTNMTTTRSTSPSKVRGSVIPKSALQHFRPTQTALPASREAGTATDMRLAVHTRQDRDPDDRFGVIPEKLPTNGNWEIVWAHPNVKGRTNLSPLRGSQVVEEFPITALSPTKARKASADSEASSGTESQREASGAPQRSVVETWNDTARYAGNRNGRQKYSERWYEVDADLDGKPTGPDDVGPYYTFGELGRLERRYMIQTATQPGRLNLNHTLFGKNQVAALVELLIRHPEIEHLELMNNALDDATVALLVETLCSGQSSVTTLLLKDNHLTWLTCDGLTPLLRQPLLPSSTLQASVLTELDLSDNKIGDKGVRVLCSALAEVDCKLAKLSISNSGLTEAGAFEIGKMLEYSSLKVLDMGWNMISAKGSMFLNENLRTCNLVELSLQHCGLNDTGGAFIANAIAGNETLIRVDMSTNNLSGGTCSVLSEAIKKNNKIEEINLKDNPLGLVGCRKLLQGMVANTGLKNVGLMGCSFLKYSRGNGDFNPNSPNGTYSLNLKDPVDRQIVLELLRLKQDQGPECWTGVKLDGKDLQPTDYQMWPDQNMPEQGKLNVTFQWVKCPSNRSDRPLEEREFEVMWNAICGHSSKDPEIADEWRLSLLNTLCIDCFFSASQAQKVVSSMKYKEGMVEAGLLVYGRIMDPQNAHRLMKRVLDKQQMKNLYSRLGSLNMFNPRNPTGHYNLQLSNQAQFTVARRLLEMFQTEVDEKANEFPLRMTWNEAFLNGSPLSMELIQHPHLLSLESTGNLVVTYVEQKPIPSGVKPMKMANYSVLINILATEEAVEDPHQYIAQVDNPQVTTVMKVLRQFDSCPRGVYLTPENVVDMRLKVKSEQVAVLLLRALGVEHYVTAAMLIGFLSMVTSSQVRVEIVTAFWARVSDRTKNFSDVMRFLSKEESKIIGKRLGYYSMLDISRPSMHYKLRMYNKSEFTVAKRLFQMAINKVLTTTSTHVYMKNLHVDDVPKHVLEGPNMWQVLTGNAPDGTDPKTTLEYDFDYPDYKAMTNASNLIKKKWQQHLRLMEFKKLRANLLAPRGGFGAYPTKYPSPEGPVHRVIQ